MRWPWVSRTAYDLLVNERDHLRAETAALRAEIVAIKRVGMGMRETPRERKKRANAMPEVPPEVRRYYEGRFQSSASEAEIERQCQEMALKGAPWEEVGRWLASRLGPPPEVAEA